MSQSTRRAVAIVPVRVGSQRLPRKALLTESGRPLFAHTFEQVAQAKSFAARYVATDSDEVLASAAALRIPTVETSPTCRTGSERCAEANAGFPAPFDEIVDVQGDWPEVDPRDLDALVECLRAGDAPIATLAVPLDLADPIDAARFVDPNVVKVVCDRRGRALYFSRASIPVRRDDTPVLRQRHIGVYAFTRAALAAIRELPDSPLADAESLEQLRWLEHGFSIAVLTARNAPVGIETRADYDAFLARRAVSAKSARPSAEDVNR